MPAGPFALLPLTGRRSSIVWTEDRETARRILAGSDELFLGELRKRVGHDLGEIEIVAGPQAHDLSMLMAETCVRNRTALIGDAAHVIHPLAGLGYNLALRDIAALVEVVMEKARLGLDIGSEGNLEPFERRRRIDTMMNTVMTDALNRLFSNDIAPVRRVRDLGLRIIDRLPMLKQFLMEEAAGLTGDLPRAHERRSGLARGHFSQIERPERVLLATELVEVGPCIEARRMAVIEDETNCIVADGLDIADVHVLLSGDEHFLTRPMSLDLGTGAMSAQILGSQFKGIAQIEFYSQDAAALLQAKLLGPG